jgi:bacteriocin biosynthesis cyclodehydratase domain-containing protein
MSTEQVDRTGGTATTTMAGPRADEAYADDAEVAVTRPRLRRDVLYTQVPDGVLFHDATTGFRLQSPQAYRFACLVVPYLNGEYRVADLCAGLGEAQGRMVVDLARSLLRRGFARDVVLPDPAAADPLGGDVRRRFAAQIGYVDHHVDGAETRFARFRQTRVAVLGSDEVARWCALSLVRNGAAEVGLDADADPDGTVAQEARLAVDDGCAAEVTRLGDGRGGPLGWADLRSHDVVVVTPGARPRQLLALAEAGVPEGTTLLPAWLLGDHMVVGPLTREGSKACWRCALLRLGDNAEAADAAQLWRSLLVPTATSQAATPSDPLAAMVGNLLGYEVFRLTTGALPAETDDAVLVQDLRSLDVTREPLLPHPHCSGDHTRSGGQGPAHTGGVPELALPPGRHQPGQPVPEPGDPAVDADLARLERRHVLVQPRAGVITRFDDDTLTQVPLRVSTAEVALGGGRRRRISAVDLHHVLGARLSATRAAAAVYAARQARLPVLGSDPARVEAVSLTTGRGSLVRAAAAQPLGPHNAASGELRTAAGIGVGDDAAQARGAGLLSALGFRALEAALRGQVRIGRVRLDGAEEVADDPALTFLVRTAAGLGVDGRQLELLELGEAPQQPVPVLLARCLDPADGTSRWTVAADPSWRSAAVTALRDLLGGVQLSAELGQPADAGDLLVGDLDARVLVPTGEVAPRVGLVTTLPDALHRLAAEGSDAVVVDLPCPDLAAGGLYAAQVLLLRTGHDAH